MGQHSSHISSQARFLALILTSITAVVFGIVFIALVSIINVLSPKLFRVLIRVLKKTETLA